MRIRYRGHSLDLRLTRDWLTIRERDGAAPPISLCVDGVICEFISGTTRAFRLNEEVTDSAIIETSRLTDARSIVSVGATAAPPPPPGKSLGLSALRSAGDGLH